VINLCSSPVFGYLLAGKKKINDKMAFLSHQYDILPSTGFRFGGLKDFGNAPKRYCAVSKNRKPGCGIPAPCTTLQPFFTPPATLQPCRATNL
jgi:hypothetical protein